MLLGVVVVVAVGRFTGAGRFLGGVVVVDDGLFAGFGLVVRSVLPPIIPPRVTGPCWAAATPLVSKRTAQMQTTRWRGGIVMISPALRTEWDARRSAKGIIVLCSGGATCLWCGFVLRGRRPW